MRYIFLILSLVGTWYCWSSYETRHEEEATRKAQAEQDLVGLPLIQSRIDELSALKTKQEEELQGIIDQRDNVIEQFRQTQAQQADAAQEPEQLTALPDAALSTGRRIAILHRRYDKKAQEVSQLERKLNDAKQRFSDAKFRCEEELRQLETRLDINRIQREERKNTGDRHFRVTEDRKDLLKQQELAKQKHKAVLAKGNQLILEHTKALHQANTELKKLRAYVDKKTAELSEQPSPEAPPAVKPLTPGDEELQKIIAPHDVALNEAKNRLTRTATELTAQEKELERLERLQEGDSAAKNPGTLEWITGLSGLLFILSLILFLKKR